MKLTVSIPNDDPDSNISKKKSNMFDDNSDNISMKSGLSVFTHKKVMN